MFDFDELPEAAVAAPAAVAPTATTSGQDVEAAGDGRTCSWCGAGRDACACELELLRERGLFDFDNLEQPQHAASVHRPEPEETDFDKLAASVRRPELDETGLNNPEKPQHAASVHRSELDEPDFDKLAASVRRRELGETGLNSLEKPQHAHRPEPEETDFDKQLAASVQRPELHKTGLNNLEKPQHAASVQRRELDETGNVEKPQRAALASVLRPELDEPELCSDMDGVVRGCCEGCDGCKSWRSRRRAGVRWVGCAGSSDEEEAPSFNPGDAVHVRDHVSDDWLPGVVVSGEPLKVALDKWLAQTSGAAMELKRTGASWAMVRRRRPRCDGTPCERCGCPVSQHEKLDGWLGEVLRSLRRFRATDKNTKRELPRRSRVPAAALEWTRDDVALFVLTEGIYDPRHDGRGLQPDLAQGGGDTTSSNRSRSLPMISVVTPTSEKRHHFHPLLYESFRSQGYDPKELVVVDTGSAPSAFLLDCAGRDRRVVYRWFNVHDSRMQDLSESFMDSRDRKKPPWVRGRARAPRMKVHGGVRVEGWSLGLKRNLACHLARGPIIAHFDDDDLYAPRYLEVMGARLREAAKTRSGPSKSTEELQAAAVTLQDWHVLDLADMTFGFVSPRTEILLPEDMRDSFTYGFGFSYVYTRAAWELVKFADVEWSEDGHFTDELMGLGKPVRLVQTGSAKPLTDALAAHTHHRDTTSAGEFMDYFVPDKSGVRQITASIRLGCKVRAPTGFVHLLPLVRQAAACLELRKGDVHPVRKQLADRPCGEEVGLEEKQDFMRTPVGRSIEELARSGHHVQGTRR